MMNCCLLVREISSLAVIAFVGKAEKLKTMLNHRVKSFFKE